MKNLLISFNSENLSTIETFLRFNNIKFTEVTTWNNNLIDVSQVDDDDNNILILSLIEFIEIITVEDSLKILLSHNHRLLVWKEMEGLIWVLNNVDHLTKLDNMLADRANITIVVDGGFDFKFKNIKIEQMPFNKFTHIVRKSVEINTSDVFKDFILTMRKARPHRTLLWNKLINKNLLNKGFSIYHQVDSKNNPEWIGEKDNLCTHHEIHPSMDLYNHSFFEIVPESLYTDGHFITEKTTKPISCRLPFLVLSSPGYLKYLQSLGFKTFDGIIDESYDQEVDLEKRTDLLVEQVEKIINNGSKNFYLATRDICEHNYKRLCEITGDRDEKTDNFIFKLLSDV
jgi:hypothetical protein